MTQYLTLRNGLLVGGLGVALYGVGFGKMKTSHAFLLAGALVIAGLLVKDTNPTAIA